eukprot:Rhum_TRINITY_DN15065_c11_g1::Rhum_TRINITY_DN15065_c11_g1_i1::g.137387::m.137387
MRKDIGLQLGLLLLLPEHFRVAADLQHVGGLRFALPRQRRRHPCRLAATLPDGGVDVHPSPSLRDEAHRHDGHVVVNGSDAHTAVPAHRSVDSLVRHAKAVHVVVGVSSHRADHVRRVDEEAATTDRLLEMIVDPVPHKLADVAVDGVSRRVLLARRAVLHAGTLRHHHHRVTLALQTVLDVVQQAAGSLELEVHLRDQHRVAHVRRHGRVPRHEAGVATHQAHDADAVVARRRLDEGAADGADGRADGGVEPKGPVEVEDVVVDGFGDPDDADLRLALLHNLEQHVGGPLRTVAAHDVEVVDVQHAQHVDDEVGVEAAASGTQDAAAVLVD